jgi:hypothetical protein
MIQSVLALSDQIPKHPMAIRTFGSTVRPPIEPIPSYQDVVMNEADFSGTAR